MKAKFRQLALSILRFLAKKKLKKIQPKIVGITGSAGKTSGKEAIAAVLERRFEIKKSEKNLNTEFGAVLSILEQKSGYSSVGKWLGILVRSLWSTLKKQDGYDLFVLEMGVDKPGDMDEILQVVQPDVMVFLNVKNVHRAEGQFANRKAIFEEKSKAALAVPRDGWVVLNADDNFVKQLHGQLPASTITIGTSDDCDLCARHIVMSPKGLKFTLAYEDKERLVYLPNVLGDCHVTMILAAIAVGFLNEIPWKAIDLALKEFTLPPGRMNLLEGKNGSQIIDSSYNASPDTMEAALEVLDLFSGRKIAALGTMNELGELTESAHLKTGKMAAEVADILIAVGEHAKYLAEGAQRGGMSASMIHSFRTSKEAGRFLSEMIERNDVVLAKGSQNNVRMEHMVKMCMKEPEQARHLLIRQEPYWLTHI